MKEVSFSDFYQAYKTSGIQILDVREQEEYEVLHLEGVQLLPLSTLPNQYRQLERDQVYYVICKSGMRSARACLFLEELGYDVINVQGGMDALESSVE
ncbi:Rhodanese-like domain protein [Streptococcus sp. DD10]|uniref:rhodanese-like domain-containing protein n=1 Tax=Streptococcus sp. DD10 TaxID=1777878 RepID=UPI0007994B24|nr:rhodanese-like domain-containing protein [Streptococcus sp. DD10]KXT77196.1 Rhodanese-like domain protein [Streptococcus sp. DD10]